MAAANRNPFAVQHVAQHSTARERVIEMQFIEPPHDFQIPPSIASGRSFSEPMTTKASAAPRAKIGTVGGAHERERNRRRGLVCGRRRGSGARLTSGRCCIELLWAKFAKSPLILFVILARCGRFSANATVPFRHRQFFEFFNSIQNPTPRRPDPRQRHSMLLRDRTGSPRFSSVPCPVTVKDALFDETVRPARRACA